MSTAGGIGTFTYMAPETILGEDKATGATPKVDVWAFGVIAYQLATLELPYEASPQQLFIDMFHNFNRKYVFEISCQQSVIKFIEQCKTCKTGPARQTGFEGVQQFGDF